MIPESTQAYNFLTDEHENEPLKRLPSGTLVEVHWERCMDSLQCLIYSGQLRQRVQAMPILNPGHYLRSNREWQRAFVIVSMISQGYVWGNRNDTTETVLPNSLAIPWRLLADKIGCQPIINYAATVQYNWHKINPCLPLSIYNIGTNSLMTGSMDEAWFYLISAAIEAKSSVILPMICQLYSVLQKEPVSYRAILDLLAPLPAHINDMQVLLNKMREECLPWVFYHRVRIYVSGWQNNSAFPEQGLTYGSKLDAGTKLELIQTQGFDAAWMQQFEPVSFSFAGASAAQSPLIQCIDALLGVSHERNKTKTEAYLMQMRQYMPAEHREMIEWIESWPVKLRSIEPMAVSSSEAMPSAEWLQVKTLINDCLLALEAFRSDHIKIVTSYVIQQVGMAKKAFVQDAEKQALEKMSEAKIEHSQAFDRLRLSDKNDCMDPNGKVIVRGTGGTDLVPFLKSIRDDVKASFLS